MVISLIKYPNNINKNITSKKQIKIFANRGMTLEYDINLSNEYYLSKEIAVIHKKPTPIQIVEEVNGIIKKAYFKEVSTTDYNGICNGKYIDFDAKETKSNTSFPISNIHYHQIKHLKNVANQGGIAFLIVRFTRINKTYILYASDLIDFLNNEKRKSIPLSYFEEKGILVKEKLAPRVDYIEALNIGG